MFLCVCMSCRCLHVQLYSGGVSCAQILLDRLKSIGRRDISILSSVSSTLEKLLSPVFSSSYPEFASKTSQIVALPDFRGRSTLCLPKRSLYSRICWLQRLSVPWQTWPAHCHFSLPFELC